MSFQAVLHAADDLNALYSGIDDDLSTAFDREDQRHPQAEGSGYNTIGDIDLGRPCEYWEDHADLESRAAAALVCSCMDMGSS